MENFKTELEYWQNEVKQAFGDWLKETEEYHKYMDQFFTVSTNGVIEREATKSLNREEFNKIIEMKDKIDEKNQKLKNLTEIWHSLRKK